METTQDRVERGLAQLGKDIVALVKGKPLEHSNNSDETIVESDCNPLVQNVIYNYSVETQTPTQSIKFNFIDVVKIVFCIIVIVVVVKTVFDPLWFVDGFNNVVRFFHSI